MKTLKIYKENQFYKVKQKAFTVTRIDSKDIQNLQINDYKKKKLNKK